MSKPRTKAVAKAKERPVQEVAKPGETEEAATARTLLRPTLNAALIASTYKSIVFGNTDVQLTDLVSELSAQCDAVLRGDLGRAEAMLSAQAHALDSIFTNLAMRASRNFGENLERGERYMRLALRAQSQCRATLESLAAVKNPPVVIARQANVTTGPQQVNNGLARENSIEPNKLLEQSNGKWLDGAAARQASGGDQAMAAVGAVDRPKVS